MTLGMALFLSKSKMCLPPLPWRGEEGTQESLCKLSSTKRVLASPTSVDRVGFTPQAGGTKGLG